MGQQHSVYDIEVPIESLSNIINKGFVILKHHQGDLGSSEIKVETPTTEEKTTSEEKMSSEEKTTPVEITNDVPFTINGHVIGILGNYKVGKTWLLNQIEGFTFKYGRTSNTKGICMKCTKRRVSKEERSLYLDCAGSNSPIKIYGGQRLEELSLDLQKTEMFLNSLVFGLSDYVLIVIGRMSNADQILIQKIMEVKSKFKDIYRQKQIFIIHNLKEIHRKSQMETTFNEMMNLYGVSKSNTQDGVQYFTDSDDARHLFLMNHYTKNGKTHNRKVFNLIRTWIDSILTTSNNEPFNPISKFLETCHLLLPNYLKNYKNLQFNEQENRFYLIPESDHEPIKLKSGQDDCLTAAKITKLFVPKQRVIVNEEYYEVQLEIPELEGGVEGTEVKKISTKSLNCFGVRITGERKCSYSKTEWNDMNSGKFSVEIAVPNDYSFREIVEDYRDGIYTIRFKKDEINDKTKLKSIMM